MFSSTAFLRHLGAFAGVCFQCHERSSQSARWQQHLKQPVLLPISAWPRYSLSLLNINIYDMYLGIEPISLRGEGKKNGWCAKLAHCSFLQASVCLSPSRASRQAFSPRSNCYLAQSSHPLQLQSSLSPFFHLLPLSPPGARKHTLITVSYLWWCFNNSWPQVSGACAGVVRVIHHDLANLSLNCQGHSRLCNGKCGQRQQP